MLDTCTLSNTIDIKIQKFLLPILDLKKIEKLFVTKPDELLQ